MSEHLRFDIIKNWYGKNEQYVSKIETLLEDYFNPDTLGNNGYINIGQYKTEEAKKFTPESKTQKLLLKPITTDVDAEFPDEFSGYEKLLFSHIFYGSMDTYVISGPMGSGKTTSINYIIARGKELASLKDTVHIYLDFNQGFTSLEIKSLVTEFYEKLYCKLKVEIIENVFKYELTTEFLNHIKDNYANFSRFYDFSFDNLDAEYANWKQLDEKQKVHHVFKYIQKYTKRNETRVDMTMKFINFLNIFLEKKKVKLIITYDNIDKLVPVAQRNIMSKILAFNKIAKTKKIITIRRSTKAKLDKIIDRSQERMNRQNRSQTIYGHIYHHGPSPIRVYIIRLRELVQDIDDSVYFNVLSQDEKEAVKLRANEILKYLDHGNSFLKQAFHCLSGESNRLGLTIGNRPFANYFSPFNSKSLHQHQLIQGFYVGSEPSLRMSHFDDYVANLFSDYRTNEFTLINYHLLSIVKQGRQMDRAFRVASYIYDILYDSFDYSDEEIIYAFNYLMDDRRALIGGEFRPAYKDSEELFRLDDRIRITELGERYFDGLLMNGTRYLQECLLSLKWPVKQNVQTYEYTVSGRFQALRDCLYDIEENEKFREKTYEYNLDSYEAHPFKFINIERHLLGHFANSFIFVTQGMDKLSYSLQVEIEAWLYLLERKEIDAEFAKKIQILRNILRRTAVSR